MKKLKVYGLAHGNIAPMRVFSVDYTGPDLTIPDLNYPYRT